VKSHSDVIGCAAAVWRPIDPNNEYDTNFFLRERPLPAGTIWVSFISPVTPDYPTTMGIPLMRGRMFTTRDTATSPGVMIVNQAWAAQYAPNANPIGMHVREGVWFGKNDAPRDREIVGIIGNVRQVSLDERPKAMMYVPHAQAPAPDMNIVMRMQPGSGDAAEILGDEVHRLDPDIPLYNAMTMTSVLSRSVARPRMYAAVNAMLAFVAIVLAVVGVYGVLSFLVIQRQQELGIRMALGAAPGAIARLVFERGAALVAFGTVAGTAGAIGVGRLADALLYDTSSRDPLVMLGVVGIVMTAGLAASAIPALRSSRIDPASILRGDA
jgi:putative ABC transport system permease protein